MSKNDAPNSDTPANDRNPEELKAPSREGEDASPQEDPVCAICGHPIEPDDIVCPNCGESLVAG